MGERLIGIWDGIRMRHQWRYGRVYFRWTTATAATVYLGLPFILFCTALMGIGAWIGRITQ